MSHSQGPGCRLVEVVAVEDELPLGRAEHAEIGEVGVPADLSVEPRVRRARQIRCHDQGRAAEEGERGDQHAAVADGHQRGHPGRRLLFEQRHRVGSVRGRFERGVAGPGRLDPGLLAPRLALGLGPVRNDRYRPLCQADLLVLSHARPPPRHVAAPLFRVRGYDHSPSLRTNGPRAGARRVPGAQVRITFDPFPTLRAESQWRSRDAPRRKRPRGEHNRPVTRVGPGMRGAE